MQSSDRKAVRWNVKFLEQLLPDPLTRAAGQRDRALL
jgi:hypothetical protein